MKHDVVIVGAGPAGSVMGWELARRGVKVVLLDGARFPRDKVCGDYVEPRGLRLLDRMGCLETLEQGALPISRSVTYVSGERCYDGPIPFYGVRPELPPHGYIIPRETLDHVLLQAAARGGATIQEDARVTAVRPRGGAVEVDVRRGNQRTCYRSRLVVGADGVHSLVARSAGILTEDARYTALAQRAYAEGVTTDVGEAAFFFDEDLFPGYGWAFPLAGGRVNLGVGILAETRERLGVNVPQLFRSFFHKLRDAHPRWRKLRLCRPPIGGIVRTYGGAGPNYFDGGLLIGDAGSFVDPMTGEGINPAMESALIAARVATRALEVGRFDIRILSAYEREFRDYFDPALLFLDLCAAILRNRHFSRSWLSALKRGCARAQTDLDFARTTGACFGGIEVNPIGILGQIWVHTLGDLMGLSLRSLGLAAGARGSSRPSIADLVAWQVDWWRSVIDDPIWHTSWTLDLQAKWFGVLGRLGRQRTDPRGAGVPVYV